MLTIKKQGKIAAVLVLAVTFLTACGPPGPRALTQGQQLLTSGKTSEAAAKFEQAVQLLGNESPLALAQAYNWLGLAYHQSGQLDKAAVAYKKATDLDRNLSSALYNVGFLEYERGNYYNAVNAFNTCLGLPRPPELRDAEIYLKLGSSYIRLAGLSNSTNDRNRYYDTAKRCLEQALKLAPSAEGQNGLGIVWLYRLRSPNDAVSHFLEARKIQQNYAPARLNLAIVYQFYLNDRRSAIQEYQAYLQCLPNASNAGEVNAQIKELEREPSSKPVVTAQPSPKAETAPVEPTPAPVAASKGTEARYRYMTSFAPTAGNRKEATQILATGVQLLQGAKNNEAIEAFQKAVKADPSYFDAYYYLGASTRESGNMAASLDALEKAVALKPDSAETRYAFAWALHKTRYLQDSANELEKLLKQTPNDTRAHLFLANLYAQELSQPKLARVHYTQVLNADPNHPQAGAIKHWLSSNP